MQELTHYIGGEHVKGTSGRFADVYNPATGEVQAKVPLASADEMAKAVEIAAEAQVAWEKVNPQRRARVMMKFVGPSEPRYGQIGRSPEPRTRQNNS
jgi:malonate-semialdehyde dehydrogenase (acetylating)/methylmalonate-semialdehyde dehydrogenase